MNLFVNDTLVKLRKPGSIPAEGTYNHVIDARKEEISKVKLIHHVWIQDAITNDIQVVLNLLSSKVPTNLLSLQITTEHYEEIKEFLKKQFKMIKAAGGLVRKKDKSLMIYRLKKWDLPKGKKESGETYPQAAIREIYEECNVDVKLGEKICTTWHTYTMNKNSMLKRTKWYLMTVLDDSKMKPCLVEDIEDLRWMTQKDVYHALENSYKSIQFVFEEYYHKKESLGLDNIDR